MEEEKSVPSNDMDAWLDSGTIANEINARKTEHYSNLVHRVFAQTEAGRELMDIWTESLLKTPVARANSTQIEMGIQEGMNQVTRTIINICNSVEAETKE